MRRFWLLLHSPFQYHDRISENPERRNLAFIKDPDGYWIEILNNIHSGQFADWPGNQQ